jgi:riboflavin synthase
MFTGIIEAVGKITSLHSNGANLDLKVSSEFEFKEVKIGSSISVNGVCLTVIGKGKYGSVQSLEFEVSQESLVRTNFSKLKKGDRVNLERALEINSRLDGHFVLGHIDAQASVKSITSKSRTDKVFEFEFDQALRGLIVNKGSVAVNGISLTSYDVTDSTFKIVALPYTVQMTSLSDLKTGDSVNIEVDIIGKYVQRLLEKGKKDSKISFQFLAEHGFLGGK